MKILVGAVLASFMVCGSASAQSTEADISARLMGKPLLLRGFWMDDKLRFDAVGSPLGDYKTGPFTLAGFDLAKISVSRDHLKLEGTRMALLFDRDGRMDRSTLSKGIGSGAPEKVVIEIDGHGDRDFRKELDAIFAESVEELIPSLPDCWQKYARIKYGSTEDLAAKEPATSPEVRDGTNDRPYEIGSTPRSIAAGVKPPKLLYVEDPQFTDAARRLKYSGNVLVGLQVENDGTPSHVSVVRPAGAGLDEEAVAAVERYRFAPATRNGDPVTVELSVEVNFQIF